METRLKNQRKLLHEQKEGDWMAIVLLIIHFIRKRYATGVKQERNETGKARRKMAKQKKNASRLVEQNSSR